MESVASSGWSNEPTLDFVAYVVTLVGRNLQLSHQLLSMILMVPIGPINGACLIIEFGIESI
jgi:hypothetical protein